MTVDMRLRGKIGLIIIAVLGVICAWYVLTHRHDLALISTKGPIAAQQRDLMKIAVLLGMIVLIPVYAMTALFAIKYRDSNKKAKYTPNWDNHLGLEAVWWGIPIAIISVLAVVTWVSSHRLDPYKPLASKEEPVNVQVVALQWKWLFIYPDLGIASVNQLQFPVDTPVNFTITSDAPMNSFWIPRLGGQVYAMTGMSTKLHLEASEIGTYPGVSANISGEGFSDMKFTAKASTRENFEVWVNSIKSSARGLDTIAYQDLAKPSTLKQPEHYVLLDPQLYDHVVNKYMKPSHSLSQPNQTHNHTDMDMHDMEMNMEAH